MFCLGELIWTTYLLVSCLDLTICACISCAGVESSFFFRLSLEDEIAKATLEPKLDTFEHPQSDTV